MKWKRGIAPSSGAFVYIVLATTISFCHARSPTPCEIRKEDELGQHVWCHSIPNAATIISYLDEVNSVPAHLLIGTNSEFVQTVTREDFRNPVFGNLQQFSLVQNGITEFNPEVFTGLPKLHKLHVFLNNIASIDENTFAGLNLTVLLLNENQITNIAEGTFRNLPHLSQLYLSNNNLNELPATLFQGLTDLVDLQLDKNHLTNLDENAFQSLEYLLTLNLAHNKITSLSPNVLQPLAQITDLNLSHNLLEAIDLSNAHLTNLDLSNNNFSNLSRVILNLRSLRELIVQNNNISQLRPEYFSHLPNLELLNLSNNQLKNVQTSTFETLNKLELVYLGGNDWLSVIVDGFRKSDWQGGHTRQYSVITSNQPVYCLLPYYEALRKWFDDNNYNFDKVFSCAELGKYIIKRN